MSADLQLYRTAILAAIDWPENNRRFQSDLAALLYQLALPVDYCHEFTGDGLGYSGEVTAIEQRVARALRESKAATRETGVKLFEYTPGGGQLKRPTKYHTSYLNRAAEALRDAVAADHEAVPLAVKIDRHLRTGTILLPPLIAPVPPPPRIKLHRKPPVVDHGEGLSAYGIAAEQHAREGFRIVPLYSAPEGTCDCKDLAECDRPGKHGRLRKYHQAASRYEQVIRKWYRRWPDAGVGLLTGIQLRPGLWLVVIDVDRRHFGQFTWREALYDLDMEMPETRTVITSNGWHYYFLIESNRAPRSFRLNKGAVDIKGTGQLVVAPPTLRNGHTYHEETDTPIAIAEGALAEWLLGGHATGEIITEGRHDWLKGCARRLAGDRYSEADILTTLKQRRDTKCAKLSAKGRVIEDEELARMASWAYTIEREERQEGTRVA